MRGAVDLEDDGPGEGMVRERLLATRAHERAVAEQILLRLRHALGDKVNRTPEEQEFIMTMDDTWEDARAQGRDEGHEEGR